MQDAPHRDLASAEVWEASLERSRRRRVLAARGRREVARRKQAAGVVSAAMAVSPTAAAFASAGFGGGGAKVAAASPANRAIAPGAPAQLLRMGAAGPDVVRIQSALGQAPDGIFGPQTNAAVRVFQSRNGLLVDGIVGPRTWHTLFGPHGAAYDSATPQYQFKIQRASAAESATVRPAIGGKGPVAKIVLRTVPRSNVRPPVKSHRATPVSDQTAPTVTTPEHHTTPVSTAPVSTSCGSNRIVAPVRNYTVTGAFGEQRPGHTHAGIDLAVPYGTPIVAAACGVVVQAGAEGGYGNIVCVRHSSTFTTCYAHMSRFAAQVGQSVHQGEVIGYVGTTGDATGPHVHFETRVNGAPVDPAPYLSGSKRAKATHAQAAKSSAPARAASSSGSGARTGASGPGGSPTGSGHATGAAGPGMGSAQQASTQRQEASAAPAVAPAPAAQSAPAPASTSQQAPAAPATDSAPAAPADPAPAAGSAPAATATPAPSSAPAPAPASGGDSAPTSAPAVDPAPAAAPAHAAAPAAAPDPAPAANPAPGADAAPAAQPPVDAAQVASTPPAAQQAP